MHALLEDNVTLATENRRLRASLEGRLRMSVESPTLEGGLGGRTALQQFGNVNVGRFIDHMNEVGTRALVQGTKAAKVFLQGPVSRDLHVVFAAPALTVDEQRRRTDLEEMLGSDWGLEILSRTDERGESARWDFIRGVMRSGIDTVAQELLRRSAETPVGREVRRDDDGS